MYNYKCVPKCDEKSSRIVRINKNTFFVECDICGTSPSCIRTSKEILTDMKKLTHEYCICYNCKVVKPFICMNCNYYTNEVCCADCYYGELAKERRGWY